MHMPSVADVLCIACIRTVHCSEVTKRVWCPYSTNALTWALRECGYTRMKVQYNKCGAYSERQTRPLVEEDTSFTNTQTVLERP
jgi:hypothetical protein